jgi:hypothetical protein
VAVVYAVMVEPGYNRTELGKIILATCFVNDIGTVLALGLIFAKYNLYLAIFVVVTIAVDAVVLTLLAGTDIDPRVVKRNFGPSVNVGLMGFFALFLGALRPWPVVTASPNRRHHLVLNLSRETYSTAGECAVQDRAKQFPVKPLHLHLLDRREISRAGIDRDPRQEHSDL